ncbi:dTMP kinase [Actinoplanes oblitus]|uniref:Thymidylate kinase n=1 Tax=Actinoplanes oblitus TaxID=3040509 RepID=A0ABY8WT69_9ACTN|nr:dTMP kinase [Actinoplanes oblitus]WIN00071.1 dTMP kinase [Actinoplanes oblitus]
MTTGRFIVVDGPSGTGKSTVTRLLVDLLAAAGEQVLLTQEPSDGPIGRLARAGTHEYRGIELAALVIADRYHHLHTVVRPAVAAGKIVLCDRYLPSSLVLQEADGVPQEIVWAMNTDVDRPNLTVLLLADPGHSRQRVRQRGIYSRFHLAIPDERRRYEQLVRPLFEAGHRPVTCEIGNRDADAVASGLVDLVLDPTDVQDAATADRDTTSS